MTQSKQNQTPMDALNEYLVPLAVCGTALVAAVIYMKNAMAVEPLAPAPVEKKKDKKKDKKAAKKAAAKAAPAVEITKESDVEEEAAAPPKPIETKKKTGAQKRREKKEREAAALDAVAAPKKAAPKKEQPAKKAAEPVNSRPAPVDEDWQTIEETPKQVAGKKAESKGQVAAKPTPAEKAKKAAESKKQAKDRADAQRAKARPDDYLKNLPVEVQEQMKRFNNYETTAAASPSKGDNDDIWAEVKQVDRVKKVENTEVAAPVVETIKFVKPSVQYETGFTNCWEMTEADKDKVVSKTKFSGLQAAW